MRTDRLRDAFAFAVITALMAMPILGVRISQVGPTTTLEGRWTWVLWAALAVFVIRLTHDALAKLFDAIPRPRAPSLPVLPKSVQKFLPLIVLLVAAIWSFYGPRGAVDVMTLALIYAVLGLGLNIVVGFAGLLDLGYVAFYAVGAYTYALLSMYFDLSFWICLPIAGGLAALFGILLGFPVLRLRGDYLAIVTLGFGEIIRLLLNNWDSLTRGPDGIGNIPKPSLFGLEMTRNARVEGGMTFHNFLGIDYQGSHVVIFGFLLALVLVAVSLFVINRLLRMPIGRAWEAMREDEIACRSLGLNPTLIKLNAFALGAGFAGFAGCLFAARQGFINPESFTFIESAIVLAIVVLGGMGSQLGVVLAALALTLLPELAREFEGFRMLLFGFVMIVMMIWRPQGLLPAKRPHVEMPQ